MEEPFVGCRGFAPQARKKIHAPALQKSPLHRRAFVQILAKTKADISKNNFDDVAQQLRILANIANDYPDLNNELLKFIAKYNQSEAKGIIYEQLSDKRRNTLKSFVATVNFVETSKKLVDEIAKAGLTVQFAGGFDFIRTDGKLLPLNLMTLNWQ